MDAGADAAEGKERRRSMPHLSPAATLSVSLYYRLIVLPAPCIAGSVYCRLRIWPFLCCGLRCCPFLCCPFLCCPFCCGPFLRCLFLCPCCMLCGPSSWFPPLPRVPLQAVSLRHALRPAPWFPRCAPSVSPQLPPPSPARQRCCRLLPSGGLPVHVRRHLPFFDTRQSCQSCFSPIVLLDPFILARLFSRLAKRAHEAD